MALVNSMEQEGNWLFKYRGQLPVVLFLLAVPAVSFSRYIVVNNQVTTAVNVISIAVSIAGFIIRAYTVGTTPRGTSGRNTSEQTAEVLNSKGIYSMVRHPLYVGNYLMWMGIVLYTYNFCFVIIISLLFWLYYERIMFAEEQFLRSRFGGSFDEWANRVPAFIPAFRKFVKGDVTFSFKSVLRREYSGVLATVIGFAYVEVLRNYFFRKEWMLSMITLIVLAVTVVTTLLLRTLTHSTTLLNEEGRS